MIGELVADAQARCRAAQAMRESEERYRTLAEAAQDMIFIIAADDTVQYVNTHAARHLGLLPQDIVGQPRAHFFPADTSAHQAAALRSVRETGQSLYAEDETLFGENRIWLGSSLVPIRDASGTVQAVLGISRDITSHRRAEAA